MHFLALAFLLAAHTLLAVPSARAAIVPGFQDAAVATVAAPSVLAFAPDGRLFIGEKSSGKVRVYENGALAAQPFLNANDVVPAGTYFDTFNERGVLGIAFDPAFATNGFVYVYYTVCKTPAVPPQPGTNTCQSAKSRVARVTASGNVADPASHIVLLDDIDSDAGNHNGGWLGFGPVDGKLYVAVGDGGANSAKAQVLGSLSGKILRLNANGSIPSDNPFVGRAGARGEVFAWGLRNPYRCRFASDGRLFCADVGQVDVEELNVVTAGANYGWPTTEGTFDAASNPQLTNPIYVYRHDGVNAAIIAGDFGAKTAFPGSYQQSFFFADFTRGFIRRALLGASGVTVQAVDDLLTNIGGNSVTDLVAGPDGSLYYTAYSANQVRRLTATSTNRSPTAAASANVVTGIPPLTVQFSSAGSSDPDGDALSYSWSFGDGTATSAVANPTHQYTTAGAYVATLTVSDGMATPGPGTDTVTIAVGRPPVVTIGAPTDGASFRAGDMVVLDGTATDPEDGVIPAGNLHWKVIFHHADHIHPFIDDLPGSPQSFTTNTGGEPDPDVGYEIQLSATDATGLTGTASAFILPVTSHSTVQTSPPGLGVTLDGQPMTAPVGVTGVVGLHRMIGAAPIQTVGAATWYLAGWSDGGLPTHEMVTPEDDTTFTATFMPPATCAAPFVLPAEGGTLTTATGGAAGGSGNLSGTCGTGTPSAEQVFQWTPVRSGTATIQTCGGATSFDTVLYVRNGACATGAELTCADDAGGCATTEPNDHHASRATLAVTAGQTYFIVVDGYGGASGTFTLTVAPPSGAAPTATRTGTPTAPTITPTRTATAVVAVSSTATPALPTASPLGVATPAPLPTATAASAACDAVVVPPDGGTFTGVTSGASTLAGTCSVSGNSPERVYQWTPAVSGTAIVATCGGVTSFDTALYVRSGSCGGAQVACNDDSAGCATGEPSDHHGSRANVAVTAGQTYFIVVDGYNGANGTYTLAITPPGGTTPTRTVTPGRTGTPGATITPPPTATIVATATPVPTASVTPAPSLALASTATRTPTPTTTASAPSNACSEPTVVPAEGGTFASTTTGSSTQTGSCAVTGKSGERVFQWTPATSGQATIGTCGASTLFDTVVYLRTGLCEGADVACVDDASGCSTGEPSAHHGSRLTPLVTAGQTYFIVVDGYEGASGAFSLTIAPPAGPTASATPTPGPTASLTRTPTPIATITYAPTATTAAAVPTTTQIPTAALPIPTATPRADACAAPTILPPEGGTFSDVTAGTSSQAGSCSFTNKAPERVFQWTAPASGTATFSTCGSDTRYDTVLYVRADACGGPELACNDDTTGCGTGEPSTYHGSRIGRTVVAGATYFIVVDGYDAGAGAFALTVTPPVAATMTRAATPAATATAVPPTATPGVAATTSPTAAPTTVPDPCGATVVPAEGGTFAATTAGTNLQNGTCGLSDKGPEAIFRWTPAVSGPATIATCGTSTRYDTVLYMRSGSCTGPELGCNDDTAGCGAGDPSDYHASRLTPTVTAGETYYVVVDGYNGAKGAFGLTITPPTP